MNKPDHSLQFVYECLDEGWLRVEEMYKAWLFLFTDAGDSGWYSLPLQGTTISCLSLVLSAALADAQD